MPRLHLYLPDDLRKEVKRRRLPPSELLQQAVRDELWRRKLESETVGSAVGAQKSVRAPTKKDVAWAQKLSRRIAARRTKRAG